MTSQDIKIINFNSGEIASRVFELPDDLKFGNSRSLSYAVRWQLARRRPGSAKTKTMSEISGTTAKPWKQKGTGRARQGSERSVQFVGGRTCHGPLPRSFDFSIPKKIVKVAIADALISKFVDKKVFLFNIDGMAQKTKSFFSVLKKAQLVDTLFICNPSSQDSMLLFKSARNIKNIKVIGLDNINPYEVLLYKNLLIDSSIFDTLVTKNILEC